MEKLQKNYEMQSPFGFDYALQALNDGVSVYREGWNGKGMWLSLQNPDEKSLMTLPYIYINTVSGDRVPWVVSQKDLFAYDWRLKEPK